MVPSFEKGRTLFSTQKYEVTNEVVNGETVAIELLWIAKLAVSYGNVPAGSELRAYSAIVPEF